jgi:hypothetical protein
MIDLLRRSDLLIILAAVLIEASVNQALPQAGVGHSLEAISKGNLRNRKSFDFLTCRYQMRAGTAESLESAKRGELQNTRKWDVVWVTKGSMVKYASTCDEASLKAYKAKFAAEEGSKQIDLRESWGVLTDGRLILRHSPAIMAVNISVPDVVDPDIRATPFGMGIMGSNETSNPGSVFQKCVDGKFYGIVEGLEIINGAKLVKVNVGLTKDRISRTYWLDPNRGFLPIRIDGKAPKSEELLYTAIVKETKKCSQGRWFPMSAVVIDSPQRKTGSLYVREYQVLDLDVDKEPKNAAFDIEITSDGSLFQP